MKLRTSSLAPENAHSSAPDLTGWHEGWVITVRAVLLFDNGSGVLHNVFDIDSSVLHNVFGIDSSVLRNVFDIDSSVLHNVFGIDSSVLHNVFGRDFSRFLKFFRWF